MQELELRGEQEERGESKEDEVLQKRERSSKATSNEATTIRRQLRQKRCQKHPGLIFKYSVLIFKYSTLVYFERR